MHRTRQLARNLLLTGLMLGLGVMGLLRHHHGHAASHLANSHHSLPVHPHGRRAGQSSRRGGDHSLSAGDHFDLASAHRVGAGGDPVFAVVQALVGPTLRFARAANGSPLRGRDEVAVGGAARAPGDPRGPPQNI